MHMAYKQVYTMEEQNLILQEGGEQAIEKLYSAYAKQINDYVVRLMRGYGQNLTKEKIEDCQSAAKEKVCEIIVKKPVLTADFMAYIEDAVRYAVGNELFGQDQIVKGERNALKRAKVMKAREALIRNGNLNPSPEDIFQTVNMMFGNEGKKGKDATVYPDITEKFIRNILIKTISLDDFCEKNMPASAEKGPEEQAQDADFRDAVQRAFSALDKKDRQILALQEDKLTQKAIAKRLGMETVAYRFRKNVLETYLVAALISLGYQDACGVAEHRFEVVMGEFDNSIRPVLASLNTEEQKLLLDFLSGKKRRAGKNSKKIIEVLACLAAFDTKCGEKFGYGEINRMINQQCVSGSMK